MSNLNREVYDIETLKGAFTYTGLNIDTLKVITFVIHPSNNQLIDFLNYYEELDLAIGFNNINFDYPVIHYMYNSKDYWIDGLKSKLLTISDICNDIHKEANRIIELQNNPIKDKYASIKESEWKVFQLDLFRVWHYNNANRRTSLKNLQVSMNLDNVIEMPIDHRQEIITEEELKLVLEYNLNDVLATHKFWLLSKEKMKLRVSLNDKYKLSCFNWNNGKIGEELILKLYCEKTGKNYWEVKKLRTYRNSINLADCLPENIDFIESKFIKIKEYFQNTIIIDTKGSIKLSTIYKGLKYDYGTGGLHACITEGVYQSDDTFIIKTCDVASLYPFVPIVYKFWIEHLGKEFLQVYANEIVYVRLNEKQKPKDKQDLVLIDGYKESANVPYGKSNDEHSFLYDPLYSMKTTVHGQMVISKLAESISQIPNSQILMVNTDGLEIRIPRKHSDLYDSICKEWEKLTKLTLEYAEYTKMWIGDVNNYGCLSTTGKIKNKGRFEVDKSIGNEPAYHKDNSFRIIPLAIQEFFTKNISIETTIKNHTDILDFCGRQKFNSDSHGETIEIVKDDYKVTKQQKVTRYFISNKGSTFVKKYTKGTSEFIDKGYQVTIFNNKVTKEIVDYDINYQFYIKKARKEIENIIKPQLSLF